MKTERELMDFRELPKEEQRALLDKLSPKLADRWSAIVASAGPPTSDRELLAIVTAFIDEHGEISDIELDPPDGEVAMRALSMMENYIQEIGLFLAAIGKTWDDPAMLELEVGPMLDKARTLLAILDELGAKSFIPPAPPPRRGQRPDAFWDDMARKEHDGAQDGSWDREKTIAEYLKRPEADEFDSPKDKSSLQSYVRGRLRDARKRLGIPSGQKNYARTTNAK